MQKNNLIFYQAIINDINTLANNASESVNDAWHQLLHDKLPLKNNDVIIDAAVKIIDGKSIEASSNNAGLSDIFNNFGDKHTERYFTFSTLSRINTDNFFAQEHSTKITLDQYDEVIKYLINHFKNIDFNEENIPDVLNYIENVLTYIPYSKDNEDISVYDHAKAVASLAQILSSFDDFSFNDKDCFDDKNFLLMSFDISGIQDFIYTIVTQEAYKQLRSRSFYLDMISEWLVDYILSKFNLTRANLMYAGGGHGYLILPNKSEVIEELNNIEHKINQFFLDNFETRLYVVFGTSAFNGRMLTNSDGMRSNYQEISQIIAKKKLQRYSSSLQQLNNFDGQKTSVHECMICHSINSTVHQVEDHYICQLCEQLSSFSKDIQKNNYFVVNDDSENGLPIGLMINNKIAYLHCVTKDQIISNQVHGKIYVKNLTTIDVKHATRLWIGDYSFLENNDFNQYATRLWKDKECPGLQKLAVLRCDVDDLGYSFMTGFARQKHTSDFYNVFTRTAVFSRNMSMFFKFYINYFAKGQHLSIIYAGGDDVFILGAWDDIIDFTVKLRKNFIKWTNGKLKLSAGIGIFNAKTPINVMARFTGELEDAAKSNDGKDSICLFSEEYVFKFDTFINEVYEDKLPLIRDFFNHEDERGKSFIYKLMSLIDERSEKDKISFARLVYYLTRLDDDTPEDNKERFKLFKQHFIKWFKDNNEITQVKMALMLYVYEIRKDD